MLSINYTSNRSSHLIWSPDTHTHVQHGAGTACKPIDANNDYICFYDFKLINHASRIHTVQFTPTNFFLGP